MDKELEAVMLLLKVPVRVETGNPQQPMSIEPKELSKAFDMDQPIRELVNFMFKHKTHVGQLVADNSNEPTGPTGLVVPRPAGAH